MNGTLFTGDGFASHRSGPAPAKMVSIPKSQNQDVSNAIVLAEVEIPIAGGITVGIFLFTRRPK